MTNDASITTIKNKRSFLLKDSDLPGMFDPDYTIPFGDESIIQEEGEEHEDVGVHDNPGPEYDVEDEEEIPKLEIPYELLHFKYQVGQLGPNKHTIETKQVPKGTYTGEIVDGLPHGEGKFISKFSSEEYNGGFK